MGDDGDDLLRILHQSGNPWHDMQECAIHELMHMALNSRTDSHTGG